MPPRLLKRPARTSTKSQAKLKTKPKGKGKVKATVQAQKVVQGIALSQEQSFELVKIGVNAATFINGTNVPKNLNLNEVGDEILSLNSVVRGTGHPGVEKLLDWLEFGVANAVNDKCLAKFQLSVYRKEVVPEQLVEALTINFTYKDTEGNAQVQVSVSASMSDKVGKVINLGHAQNGLRDLIAQVMNASMRLGGELTGRKVSMQLLYNQNARPKQEYRGFRAASTSEILPEDCGISMGRMNNDFHGLAIKYYSAPAIDNPFRRGRDLSAMIRGLNPTAPKAVICDNTQSLLRTSKASQSDDTQQSTMQWLNDIGRGRGSNDMDTQPMTDNTSQRVRFGNHMISPELGEVGDKRIEEESDEEHEVRCECMNNDDRENLCYGYSKGKIGANFECYDCLLAESEPSILFEKIYPLCTRRRMVYYIGQYGFNDMEGLCQYMNSNQKDIQILVDSLQIEGIIKKCSKSSNQPFRFVNIEKLRIDIFDSSKHIAHTKLFAVPGIDLQGVSQNLNQLTPVTRRLRECHDGSIQGLQSEGSSTQTPTSWRSLHETLRRSSRVPGQSTPQQSNKRAGDEILSNASKKRRDALAATSPFSLRSNSSH
ncbi:hypothetical protein EYC80_002196 [Monilinia laxa]|uniref:HORMA domain-containing protein n=1 Tax=Monilinia laxa TaxID=61186 RepID=A0A5N6K3C8_MONLA|nr:hypothetical protein EYC80_002196 [Monilinia laxa]